MRVHENAKAVCLEDTSNSNMVRMHYEQTTYCIMQEYRITQEKTCDDKDEHKTAESIHENAQALCLEDISNGNMVIASMVFHEVTKYRALVSAHHREEIIQDLYTTRQDPVRGIVQAGMIRDHLMAFYHNTRMKPHKIIFYRDGVSKGQFSQVLLHEIDAIRKILQFGCACANSMCSSETCDHVHLFDNDYEDAKDIYGKPMCGRFPYDERGRIILEEGYLVYECYQSCRCSNFCRNRVLQNGVRVKLEVFKTDRKFSGNPFSNISALKSTTMKHSRVFWPSCLAITTTSSIVPRMKRSTKMWMVRSLYLSS